MFEIKIASCKGSEIEMCMECYIDENRITPLLNPLDCLANHTQYICGTCGRCICIEHDPKRGLQRWNFPFKSLEIAKLYLKKNKGKLCDKMKPLFIVEEYKEYADTQVRKLTSDEIQKYMSER